MSTARGPAWRVSRTGGVLPPGFTKRFDAAGSTGATYLFGLRIGGFRVVATGAPGAVELRYRSWPVVDLVPVRPDARTGTAVPGCSGWVRLPGGRRVRFCGFDLRPLR